MKHWKPPLALSSLCFVFLWDVLSALAELRNATIDDHYGDSLTGIVPRFSPALGGVWEGEDCRGCRVNPDPQFAFSNTYNAATYRSERMEPVSVRMDFTGK